MLAFLKDNKQPLTSWPLTRLLLLPILLCTFLATIDGPLMNVAIDAGTVVYKTSKAIDRVDGCLEESLWIGIFPKEHAVVHASFLLFDFKQNLRRWPNVAGDITRSPPIYRF